MDTHAGAVFQPLNGRTKARRTSSNPPSSRLEIGPPGNRSMKLETSSKTVLISTTGRNTHGAGALAAAVGALTTAPTTLGATAADATGATEGLAAATAARGCAGRVAATTRTAKSDDVPLATAPTTPGTAEDRCCRSRPEAAAAAVPVRRPVAAAERRGLTGLATTEAGPAVLAAESPLSATATPTACGPTNDNPNTNAAAPTRAPFLNAIDKTFRWNCEP